MPIIRIETFISAPKQMVFDLARSIDLHQVSTAHTKERAIAGKTSGLIELDEWVTWEACHFGIKQRLTSKITEMTSPDYFIDEMVSGAFNSFKHQHFFEEKGGGTLMIDVFDYVSPLGMVGRLADYLVLKKYMTNLLVKRNSFIKEHAERKIRLTNSRSKEIHNLSFRDYSIEMINIYDEDLEYSDKRCSYSKNYDDPEMTCRPSSRYGIKVIKDKKLIADCLISGCGGATVLSEHSVILYDDLLMICCSDSLICLSLPDLKLLWRISVDAVTCFQIRRIGNDILTHGELCITRVDQMGNILWEFGGADIFVSQSRMDTFEVSGERILLADWSGRKYVLDFDGNELFH